MKQEASFDLSALDVRPRAQEGVELRLLDPAGRPTPILLRVRGIDARAYQDELDAQVRRQAELAGRKQTEEEKREDFWALQGALLCGWQPALVILKGEEACEYSPAAAVRVLREHSYIWEQVRLFARERENFLPGPAKSSSAT